MSEKTTIFAVHVHDNEGIEIEVALEKGNMNVITMIGLLEQVKFDMLKDQTLQNVEKKETRYDA
jgi:hypothetical protein